MALRDHTIDWNAFTFSIKVLSVVAIVGVTGHYGLTTAQSKVYSDARQAIIVAAPAPRTLAQESQEHFPNVTPQRVINKLTIAEVIPPTGKFIAADLVHMKLYLFTDGTTTAEYPISHKGRPGTPWETPSGFYSVQTKEESHFSTIGKVYMPYSMQFYGNYFIHGQTYYPDGTPTAASFSGGCIRLETADAKKVFEFADKGTALFVYDSKNKEPLAPLTLDTTLSPDINAQSYLIADLDTGDVYAEKNAAEKRSIASVTKLMTALVANEIISFDKKISVPHGSLVNPADTTDAEEETFAVGDLFYPLLMQSSNGIAESLASYYGSKGFIRWMNATAHALDMTATTYADTSGVAAENVSNTEDLYRLAVYVANKKSFIFNITHTSTKTITAEDGTKYSIINVNAPADTEPFVGGKVGNTTAASDTMVSVLSIKKDGVERRFAVIVLGSDDQARATKSLAEWITIAVKDGGAQAACATCAAPHTYRKIQL